MPPNFSLHNVLARYKKGEISLDDAEKEIDGLRLERIGNFACIDMGRAIQCGMPEVILAEGKDTTHLAEIALRHAEAAGRCVVTRITPAQVEKIQEIARHNNLIRENHEICNVLIVSKNGIGKPKKNGCLVAVISAGRSDIRVAEEAKIIAEEMGCEIRTAYDVGAAGIHRPFPAHKPMLGADAFVVSAGHGGTFPAVVAGLVDKPVIGVPVGTGYGYMGEGRAALASMLPSCSIAVVNIVAGFTAGAFAPRITDQGAKP